MELAGGIERPVEFPSAAGFAVGEVGMAAGLEAVPKSVGAADGAVRFRAAEFSGVGVATPGSSPLDPPPARSDVDEPGGG